MTIVSGWYTQEEQTLRQAWWFSGTGWFTIIGGALNYGFGQITAGSLKRWQYIYILAGALTFLFGLWCCTMPNSPVSAWFLTPEERRVAVERLRKGQTGVRCQKIKFGQIKESFMDIKIYLVAIMMAAAWVFSLVVWSMILDAIQSLMLTSLYLGTLSMVLSRALGRWLCPPSAMIPFIQFYSSFPLAPFVSFSFLFVVIFLRLSPTPA